MSQRATGNPYAATIRAHSHPRAQPFVLDRRAHVGAPVADEPERQLQDVRGRRAPFGQQPAAAMAQQRGLLLRAGDRQAQIVERRVPAGLRRGRDFAQQARDVRVGERVAADAFDVVRRFVGRQHLQRADAIAAERREQRERGRAARAVAHRDSPADRLAVGQQVVEIIADEPTAIRLVARRERQRQRQRPALRIADPFVEVDKALAVARVLPVADGQAVHPQVQARRACAAGAHQSSRFFGAARLRAGRGARPAALGAGADAGGTARRAPARARAPAAVFATSPLSLPAGAA